MAHDGISRRHFFIGSLLAGAVPASGFGSTVSLTHLGYKSPNEKLNIGGIGAGGKGYSDLAGCDTENIVALADPDEKQAKRAFEKYPKATKYKDFREMLDKEDRNIDAVTVSTPDHMHGSAAMWAMERGKHVYCQKPLTRTIWEARELAKAAERYKVATQMGNQGYSNEGTRQCAEMIWAGDIGPVKEVHAWTNRPIWPQGLETPPKDEPVPETMDWQTWIGLGHARPYSSEIAPFKWRGFYDYGCGALGDMACHILGAPNMALLLGAPESVECIKQEGKSDFMFPTASVIRFDFPARASMPPVKIFWYDGLKAMPKIDGVPEGELIGDRNINGSLFVGEKGMLTTGCYGERTRLVPASKMQDYKFPPAMLTRSPGHYRDWIRACKGGAPACSNFSIAGPFTEWILLGVIALRTEGKVEWDSERMRIPNNKDANKLIKPKIQNGWKFS